MAQTLDPVNRSGSDRWNADLSYDNPDFAPDWKVSAQLSYLDTSQEQERDLTLFPPGALLPIGANGQIGAGSLIRFPQGYIGNPEVFERHARFNSSAIYGGFTDHTLRIGSGFNYGTLYDAKATQNFGLDPADGFAHSASRSAFYRR